MNLLFQICGLPLLIVLSLVMLVTTSVAFFLYAKVKSESLLTAFLPFTFLPLAIGLIASLIQTLDTIGMMLVEDSELQIDPVLALLVNLTPLLVGCVAVIPALSICGGGRWLLAWRASGERWFPEKTQPLDFDVEEAAETEANAYLEKLTKSRY